MKHERGKLKDKIGLPVKTIIHSVYEQELHWHNELELILVLEGSVYVGVGDKKHLLEENDLILINSHQIHSTRRTKTNNVLLAIQIDPAFYNQTYSSFSKLEFTCNSVESKDDAHFDQLRAYMAKVVWEVNKQEQGFEMKLASHLFMIAKILLDNCQHKEVESDSLLSNADILRVRSITEFMKDNYHQQITLKDIAKRENLNYYYLSSFIKDKLGVSYHEYLNEIRLDKAITLLLTTDNSITDISNSVGFANINSFNIAFKNAYDITPSEYRREEVQPTYIISGNIRSYQDIDRSTALKKLFTYLDKEIDNQSSKNIEERVYIEIDANNNLGKLDKHWQKVTSFSRANEGLRVNVQRQLLTLKSHISFEYVRFHGIFSDEMMVYNVSDSGEVIYNWTYVDEFLDLILSKGIRPFFDLTFMPSDLSKNDATIFWWKGNVSPPKDLSLWADLILAFVEHLVSRYSLAEVETWYFEVWNQPDLINVYWTGDQQEYFDFYKITVETIKSVSSKIKVGGPSIIYGAIEGEKNWLMDFLNFIKDEDVTIDFISVHIFQESLTALESKKALDKIMAGKDPMLVVNETTLIFRPEGYFSELLKDLSKDIKHVIGKELPIYVTEANGAANFGNLVNDTAYIATFIVKNFLDTINMAEIITYWSFTDLMEENRLGLSHFHGGYGLISKDGFKKPGFFAFEFLSKLGEEIIALEENYIITKTGEDIQILAYNYTHFDDLFVSGDESHISNTNRYSIFKAKPDLSLQLKLENISGRFRETTYQFNRDHGSIYDTWNNMGAPENMSVNQLNYLKTQSIQKKM